MLSLAPFDTRAESHPDVKDIIKTGEWPVNGDRFEVGFSDSKNNNIIFNQFVKHC
jgi:hypothetical protein